LQDVLDSDTAPVPESGLGRVQRGSQPPV